MSTEEEKHYRSLTSYFKYLITITSIAISVISGMAIYFSYNSLSDLKEEVRTELGQMKVGIESLQLYAEKTIDRTQEQTSTQLGILKDEAKLLAINTTRKKVEESFSEGNIKYLIEKTASDKLESQLNIIVKKETSKLEGTLKTIPRLSTAYERARFGRRTREHIDTLYEYSIHHEDELIRVLAKEYLLLKGRDYEISFTEDYEDKTPEEIAIIAAKHLKVEPTNQNLEKLLNLSLEAQNSASIALAFIVIKYIIDEDLQTFDFERIYELKANIK